MPLREPAIPPNATACLLLADGTSFSGMSIGAGQTAMGELCFNTGMTGYQEILTDPSYAGQIITFTFPHIGNVGCNGADNESVFRKDARLGASALVVREPITLASSFRADCGLNAWLAEHGISGICGVDTRALTRHIRRHGAQNAVIFTVGDAGLGIAKEQASARLAAFPAMDGRELAAAASTDKTYEWTEGTWQLKPETRSRNAPNCHVIAIDYGEKLNILRLLVDRGCKVTVVPARTSAQDILSLKPDGVFLSNGPGDPAATGVYAVPVLQQLMQAGVPLFGICLGHQLLGLALGGKTAKLALGHRGANQPVKNLETGKVEITSQNHGFAVLASSLPDNVKITHLSLFDDTLEGLRATDKPVFAVQYHPESSPGPHDSQYLFDQFVAMMRPA